jgi:hypothetical protein
MKLVPALRRPAPEKGCMGGMPSYAAFWTIGPTQGARRGKFGRWEVGPPQRGDAVWLAKTVTKFSKHHQGLPKMATFEYTTNQRAASDAAQA